MTLTKTAAIPVITPAIAMRLPAPAPSFSTLKAITPVTIAAMPRIQPTQMGLSTTAVIPIIIEPRAKIPDGSADDDVPLA